MLFYIYINNVTDVLDETNLKHVLYADDLKVYVRVRTAKLMNDWTDLTSRQGVVGLGGSLFP